jgi:hypothetical protein
MILRVCFESEQAEIGPGNIPKGFERHGSFM